MRAAHVPRNVPDRKNTAPVPMPARNAVRVTVTEDTEAQGGTRRFGFRAAVRQLKIAREPGGRIWRGQLPRDLARHFPSRRTPGRPAPAVMRTAGRRASISPCRFSEATHRPPAATSNGRGGSERRVSPIWIGLCHPSEGAIHRTDDCGDNHPGRRRRRRRELVSASACR
jgi:hypothetical protein